MYYCRRCDECPVPEDDDICDECYATQCFEGTYKLTEPGELTDWGLVELDEL